MNQHTIEKPLIFVVDDEHVIARTLATILDRAGYKTEFFCNASAALAAATLRTPALMISDVVMDGMGGVELAANFAAARPEMPFLLFSGKIDAGIVAEKVGGRSGPLTILTKPIPPALLLKEVQQLLARSGYENAHAS